MMDAGKRGFQREEIRVAFSKGNPIFLSPGVNHD